MKKYLIAGLLVWLPLAITIWVLHSILGALNGMFGALVSAGQAVLPTGAYEPLQLLRNIPGLGVIILIASIFVGAFYCALVTLHRLGSCKGRIVDPELQRLRPYLVGLIGGFMGCMLTMSLTDMLPTYTLLGIITVYRRVTLVRPPMPNLPRFNGSLMLRMVGVSALTLIVFRLYVWFTFIPS